MLRRVLATALGNQALPGLVWGWGRQMAGPEKSPGCAGPGLGGGQSTPGGCWDLLPQPNRAALERVPLSPPAPPS